MTRPVPVSRGPGKGPPHRGCYAGSALQRARSADPAYDSFPMTSARPAPPAVVRLVVGSVTFLLFAANTVVLCSVLYLVALLRLVLPVASFRRGVSRLLVAIGEAWIGVNTFFLRLTQPTVYDIRGLEGLRRDVSYLVVSNHQSWVDIPVLQGMFLRRLPFLRFFLKQQLIRVPVLGLAWRALDFPFMKRHSREALEKNPALRFEDLEACLLYTSPSPRD